MAESLGDKLRRRAHEAADSGGHLSDAEMAWYQNEQARQLAERDAAEQEALAREMAIRRMMLEQQRAQAAQPEPVVREDLSPTIANAEKLPSAMAGREADATFARALFSRDSRPPEMSVPSDTDYAPARTSRTEAFLAGIDPRRGLANLGAVAMLPVDAVEALLDRLRGTQSPSRFKQSASGLSQLMGAGEIPQSRAASEYDKYEAAGELVNPANFIPLGRGAKAASEAAPELRTIASAQRALPAPSPLRQIEAVRSAEPAAIGYSEPLRITQKGRQMPLFSNEEIAALGNPRVNPGRINGPTNAQLKSDLSAAYMTSPDIQHKGRLKRLVPYIDSLGDTSEVPYSAVLKSIQREYMKPLGRKPAAPREPEQMSFQLGEGYRPAKPQYKLIDPWGQNYDSVPVLYRNGGPV